jgi:hypothetical protein
MKALVKIMLAVTFARARLLVRRLKTKAAGVRKQVLSHARSLQPFGLKRRLLINLKRELFRLKLVWAALLRAFARRFAFRFSCATHS